MTHPVLVMGAEPRSLLCIARSLHRQHIPVDVVSFSSERPPLSSRAIRRFIPLVSEEPDEATYLDALVALIRRENYDLLIPTDDSSLTFVAEHHEQLQNLLTVASPSPAVVRRVLDKDQTLEAARDSGIAVPESYEVAGLPELHAIREKLHFPLVAKGRSKRDIATSTFKVRYYQTFAELVSEFEIDPEFGKRNLLQQYCAGEGVGIGLLLHKGEVVTAFQHRRLKEFPITGGVSVLAISEPLDASLLEASIRLLRLLEWEGVAMVEFRYDRKRRSAVLMEINGRYWGTVSFAVQCGIDLPFYEWQLRHGEKPAAPHHYRVGARWRWTAGYLQRLHDLITQPPSQTLSYQPRSRAGEIFDSLRDLSPAVRSALWSLSDPLPGLLEVFLTLKRLARSDIKRVLRPMLPRQARHHLGVYRTLDRKSGSAYLRSQVLRALRLRSDKPKNLPKRIASVLFVCHGNIIRSPMAEAFLKKFLIQSGCEGIAVGSAGLSAVTGRQVDPRSLKVAREFDVILDGHRAQLLSSELVDKADVIFVMDYLNEARLLAQFPDAQEKVLLLSYREGGKAEGELKDPYEGTEEDVRSCYGELRSRVLALLPLLTSNRSVQTNENIGSPQTAR